MKIADWIWLVLAGVCAGTTPLMIKLYLTHPNEAIRIFALIVAIASLIGIFIAYLNLMKEGKLTVIPPMIKAIAVILVVLSGVVLFSEGVSWKYIFGILLGLSSFALLSSEAL